MLPQTVRVHTGTEYQGGCRHELDGRSHLYHRPCQDANDDDAGVEVDSVLRGPPGWCSRGIAPGRRASVHMAL